MYLLTASLMLSARALAAPQLDSSTSSQRSTADRLLFGNQQLQFDCNPPFPKTLWPSINELALRLGQYQPLSSDGKPISAPIKTGSTKRQEPDPNQPLELEPSVDLLGDQKFGESKVEQYEVQPEQCLYIAAVGDAGAWICNDDSKNPLTLPFERAQNAVLGAARMCLPTETEYQVLLEDCKKDGKQEVNAETCAKGKIRMSVQASSPGDDWNIVIRENDGRGSPLPKVSR